MTFSLIIYFRKMNWCFFFREKFLLYETLVKMHHIYCLACCGFVWYFNGYKSSIINKSSLYILWQGRGSGFWDSIVFGSGPSRKQIKVSPYPEINCEIFSSSKVKINEQYKNIIIFGSESRRKVFNPNPDPGVQERYLIRIRICRLAPPPCQELNKLRTWPLFAGEIT